MANTTRETQLQAIMRLSQTDSTIARAAICMNLDSKGPDSLDENVAQAKALQAGASTYSAASPGLLANGVIAYKEAKATEAVAKFGFKDADLHEVSATAIAIAQGNRSGYCGIKK